MKYLSVFLLWTLTCPAVARQPEAKVAELDESLQTETNSLNSQYLLFAPKEAPAEKLPLVIYLHGAGGVGEDLRKIRGQAGAVWQGIHKFEKGPCLLVAPQCLKRGRDGGGWQPPQLNVLLEHLHATLPVDQKRIYLTGNSMGGYGCWAWGGHSPQHFAAIAPVSGGIGTRGPKDVTPDLDQWIANLATVPVYAFAGAKDKVVPPERSERAPPDGFAHHLGGIDGPPGHGI